MVSSGINVGDETEAAEVQPSANEPAATDTGVAPEPRVLEATRQ